MSNQAITIGPVRLSYCHLFKPYAAEPGDEPKYSVTCLLPQSDKKTYNAIVAAIEEAKQRGLQKCWGGKMPPAPQIPVYDGNGLRPRDKTPFGDECKGMWVFTARSKTAPGIVNAQKQLIIDEREVYSGCYAYVSLSFYPYNSKGNKGIGCGLNHVLKYQDGEPLGGAPPSVNTAFADVPAPPETAVDPITGEPLGNDIPW